MPSKKSSQFLSVSFSQSLRRAVVCGLCVAALVGAVLLPVAPASAATRFTNGERMEGSFFDHLADGLAGDPDGGDSVVSGTLQSQVRLDSTSTPPLSPTIWKKHRWHQILQQYLTLPLKLISGAKR